MSHLLVRSRACALFQDANQLCFGANEKVPLLSGDNFLTKIKVEPLRYSDLWRAADGRYRAFQSTPEQRYLADRDYKRTRELRDRVTSFFAFADAVRAKRARAVGHGRASLHFYSRPGELPPKPRLAKLWRPIADALTSKEYKRRANELRDAVTMLQKEAIGDRAEKMFLVAGLATAPEWQGHGYATALLEAVLEMADREGDAVWLATTDAAGFYERFEFEVVAETWVAKDNPDYHGPPVPIRMMIREAGRLAV
ncbi:acyl-CoA N-acyltransferase [Epithele typhae]|uniref:acyl-CoA N-acyltransferase n=1 Tax=Epithele typhae TaxID=378194 RepID=UPI0020085591|nr:acyl-CoA N-acyltransferase [Epithele typhae]KAH9921559.1 acyl-CoA N-acyltransferase [Epithele typhae]